MGMLLFYIMSRLVYLGRRYITCVEILCRYCCLVCVVILCVFVVLCVHCCFFYFRCRTAG